MLYCLVCIITGVEMNVGDKVKCIRGAFQPPDILTKDTIYTVKEINTFGIMVNEIDESYGYWSMDRFVPAIDWFELNRSVI